MIHARASSDVHLSICTDTGHAIKLPVVKTLTASQSQIEGRGPLHHEQRAIDTKRAGIEVLAAKATCNVIREGRYFRPCDLFLQKHLLARCLNGDTSAMREMASSRCLQLMLMQYYL